MIDEGETDWKILAIDVTDPDAEKYNTDKDIPEELKTKVFTFLRDYKARNEMIYARNLSLAFVCFVPFISHFIFQIPDGNPANVFGFDNQLCSKEFALQKVNETNAHWHELITGKVERVHDCSCLI